MAVTTTKTNKPINPRGNDQSPKGYNRAELYTGKALDFDGVNDILTMPTALTSSLSTTSVTFVTNVKTDFATWTGTRDDAFSFLERGVILAFNNGSIYYYYRHQSASWRNLQVPNADFKPQEWNQMVTTIDLNADTWKAYINGIEVASSGTYSDTAIAYDANALTIGAQAGGRFFDGQIAGFKIFNTALTAAQVSDLYNNPEKIVPTGVADTALKLWLPMMEGAGTTAYDGSGNGNHGTISGATYVNGVGAPVAQSAVIDWNKGANLLANSVGVNKFVNSWAKSNTTINGDVTDPVGGTDAIEVTMNNFGLLYHTITAFTNGTGSIYMRSSTAGVQVQIGDPTGSPYETKTLTTDWVRYDYSDASSIGGLAIYNSVEGGTITIELAFPQVNAGATATPFVPTLSTAQTTPVLLPQGLTTGRDITGVNLFENVRKQGALNLDGNSWAEVHDNASVDITDAITLEAWVYWDDSSNKGILGRWHSDSLNRNYLLYKQSATNLNFYINSVAPTSYTGLNGSKGWTHIVGTYDRTNAILYIDGVGQTPVAHTAAISTGTFPIEIGRNFTTANQALTNDIAQPRIYNRALTAEEVQRNYDAGKNIYTNS